MRSLSSARILTMSEADYRNDKLDPAVPSLNYSTAKSIVVESPLHAHHAHPRLGGQKWEPTAETDAGLAFHALLLEGGAGLAVVEAADWRTKKAQDARDEARAAGSIPVLASKFAEMSAAVEVIRRRMGEMGVSLAGRSEVAVAWEEKSTTGPVLSRGKIDHLIDDRGVIIDIKTTSGSVSPDDCAGRIYDNGYDIQFAAYTSWLEKYRPELVGRTRLIFVFCERTPPYAVTPVELDGQFKHLGRQRWQRAVEIWARCLREKSWPGYVTKVTSVEPKPWAFQKEQEEVA